VKVNVTFGAGTGTAAGSEGSDSAQSALSLYRWLASGDSERP
jgi:hypothetical protein